MRPTRTALVGLLLGSLLWTGCLTRHVRQDVFDQDKIQVFLRADKRFFSDIEKGYDHPVKIAPVRMAHILSRIDLRRTAKHGNKRLPAIPTQMLYQIAEGMSQAFDKAGEDQEVVVMAIRVDRTLGILDQDYLTSFVSYVRADKLYIHLSHSDWMVKDEGRPDKKLPQPRVDDDPRRFRLYGGTAMTLIGKTSLAIAWRDPIFARPTRTKILPSGEVKRKTILLESPSEDIPSDELDPETEEVQIPVGLSPGQLRALADLEEERLSGRITETEYRMRQQEILNAP